jgi:hypothetical protein
MLVAHSSFFPLPELSQSSIASLKAWRGLTRAHSESRPLAGAEVLPKAGA